jgi:hypothetical protein
MIYAVAERWFNGLMIDLERRDLDPALIENDSLFNVLG